MQGCGPHTSYPAPAYGQQQQQQYGGASCRRYDYVDIDQEDVDDPMACTEYVTDIFEYLRESEVRLHWLVERHSRWVLLSRRSKGRAASAAGAGVF